MGRCLLIEAKLPKSYWVILFYFILFYILLNNKVHRNNTLNNVDLGLNPSNIHVTNESLANLPYVEYVSAEQSSIPNIGEPIPSLMLSNTMSLAPKIDEVRHSVLQTDVDLVCFTETWLTDFVHDNVIQIPGYNVVRRDRLFGQHGGVCLYVKESIPFEILIQYHNDQFEVLWIKARPHKLPAERHILHYHWFNLPSTLSK